MYRSQIERYIGRVLFTLVCHSWDRLGGISTWCFELHFCSAHISRKASHDFRIALRCLPCTKFALKCGLHAINDVLIAPAACAPDPRDFSRASCVCDHLQPHKPLLPPLAAQRRSTAAFRARASSSHSRAAFLVIFASLSHSAASHRCTAPASRRLWRELVFPFFFSRLLFSQSRYQI